jgi:hypothetical protein
MHDVGKIFQNRVGLNVGNILLNLKYISLINESLDEVKIVAGL